MLQSMLDLILSSMETYIILFISIFITEAITELSVKSFILAPIRNYLMSKFKFFEYLLTCGYCFSFWVTAFIMILLSIFDSLPIIINNLLNIFFIFFIIQRGSNMLHGLHDRFFSTKKDIRYNFKG